jgi:hypothetical protein
LQQAYGRPGAGTAAIDLAADGGGLAVGCGGQREPCLATQDGEDTGKLRGGVTRELDDRWEAEGEHGAGVQEEAELAGLPGEDDGQAFAEVGQHVEQAGIVCWPAACRPPGASLITQTPPHPRLAASRTRVLVPGW